MVVEAGSFVIRAKFEENVIASLDVFKKRMKEMGVDIQSVKKSAEQMNNTFGKTYGLWLNLMFLGQNLNKVFGGLRDLVWQVYLNSLFMELQLGMLNALQPILDPIIDTILDLTDAFYNLPEPVQTAVAAVVLSLGILAAALPIVTNIALLSLALKGTTIGAAASAAGATAGSFWASGFGLVIKGGLAGIIAGAFSGLIGNSDISSAIVSVTTAAGVIMLGGFAGAFIGLPALFAESITKVFLPKELSGGLVSSFATAISGISAVIAAYLGASLISATGIGFAALATYVASISFLDVTGLGEGLNQWGRDMYSWSKEHAKGFFGPFIAGYAWLYEQVPNNAEFVKETKTRLGEFDTAYWESVMGKGNLASVWDRIKGDMSVGVKSGVQEPIESTVKTTGINSTSRIKDFLKGIKGDTSGSAEGVKSAAKIGIESPFEDTMKATKVVVVDLSKSTSKELADSITANKPYLDTALQTGLVNPFILAVDNILITLNRIPTSISVGPSKMPTAVASAGATYKAVSATYGSASKAANDAANRLIQAITSNISKFAEGGVVSRPTLAMLGEKGPEAVVPLSGRGMQNNYGQNQIYFSPTTYVSVSSISSSGDIERMKRELNERWAMDFKRLTKGW